MFGDDLLVQDLDENLHEEKVLGAHDSFEEGSMGHIMMWAHKPAVA